MFHTNYMDCFPFIKACNLLVFDGPGSLPRFQIFLN